MVCVLKCAILLSFVSSISGIVIKEKSAVPLKSAILPSYLESSKKNFNTADNNNVKILSLFYNGSKKDENKDVLKLTDRISTESLAVIHHALPFNRITYNVSKAVLYPASKSTGYALDFLDDKKPIYELDNESTRNNYYSTGYVYNSPSFGLHHEPKEIKISNDPNDIATAIKVLDNFLNSHLNGDGYNSELHRPTNPILSLILSRYGRYTPDHNSHLYSYMTVNNIHNNKPFGQYKYERDQN